MVPVGILVILTIGGTALWIANDTLTRCQEACGGQEPLWCQGKLAACEGPKGEIVWRSAKGK
jgi:hypothetical protein